jgi:hypothetical protein
MKINFLTRWMAAVKKQNEFLLRSLLLASKARNILCVDFECAVKVFIVVNFRFN